MNGMKRLVGAMLCLGTGLLACGNAPGSGPEGAEGVEVAEQALNSNQGCPAGYPTTALQFDTFSSRCYSNGDWDNSNTIPASSRIFYTSDDSYFYGAECALGDHGHHYAVGISARTDAARAHSMKCSSTAHSVNGAPAEYRYLSRKNSSGQRVDDRSSSHVSYDWDVGNTKAECGFHQVVTGVAQLESGEIDGIACTPAAVSSGASSSTCNTLHFDFRNHCPNGNCGSTDWASGYYKNLCNSNQYIKGVSKKGSMGEIASILCCNW